MVIKVTKSIFITGFQLTNKQMLHRSSTKINCFSLSLPIRDNKVGENTNFFFFSQHSRQFSPNRNQI